MPSAHHDGMPFAGRRADRLDEQLLGIDRTVRLQGHDEVGRDGRPQHVLAVTAGAVQVVLLPPVVGRLIDGVPRRLMVRVAQRRVGGRRGGWEVSCAACCGWVGAGLGAAGFGAGDGAGFGGLAVADGCLAPAAVRWSQARRPSLSARRGRSWRYPRLLRLLIPAGAASRSPPQAATSSIARRLPQRVAGRPEPRPRARQSPSFLSLPECESRIVRCYAGAARPPRPVTTVAE